MIGICALAGGVIFAMAGFLAVEHRGDDGKGWDR
jgi:hypothetical protein